MCRSVRTDSGLKVKRGKRCNLSRKRLESSLEMSEHWAGVRGGGHV
jgi:hypothetical protein